jgi:hypothetical protein
MLCQGSNLQLPSRLSHLKIVFLLRKIISNPHFVHRYYNVKLGIIFLGTKIKQKTKNVFSHKIFSIKTIRAKGIRLETNMI